MNKFFIVFAILSSELLIAQPTIQWQKVFGGSEYEHSSSIHKTSDEGYIVAGQALSDDGDVWGSHGVFDYWVLKLDNEGAIQWKKALGGSDHDWAHAIRQTNEGGYIVAGMTQSDDGDVTGFHGDKDAWIVKLSNAGAIVWQRSLGGSGWEEASSIEQTSDGGYIMAGRASSIDGDVTGNHGYLDFWVVKLSSNGNIEWQKSLGGSSEDTANSIRQTSDGGYIVAGATKSDDGDVQGNNGNVDFWVVKLRSTGDIEWQNALGGSGADIASDILETEDGFIACGYAGSNNGDVTGYQGYFDGWIVNLRKNGDLIWQKTFGGSNADYFRSLVKTSDGMYVFAGETKSTDGDVVGNNGILVMWVVKVNEAGDLVWQKTLGGTDGDGGAYVQQTNDNGYILAGYAWSNNGDVSGNHGAADYWVVKLAPESISTADTPISHDPGLLLYPNPANQDLCIKTTDGESTLIVSIYDFLGREMLHLTMPNGGVLDIALFPRGLYQVLTTERFGKKYFGWFTKE